MKTITYNEQTHRLVPIEPTIEMVMARIKYSKESPYKYHETTIEGQYHAMLSAAPVFETVQETVESEGTELNQAEPVAWVVDDRLCLRIDFIETIENWKGDHVDTGRAIPYAWKPILYTAPPDYEEIKRQRDELVKVLDECRFALEPYDDIKPRDWKTDRERLVRAHQSAIAALASVKGEQK